MINYTVNRNIYRVKIFLDSMGSAKIKRTDIMSIVNANVVQGRLSENYSARHISDLQYRIIFVDVHVYNNYIIIVY